MNNTLQQNFSKPNIRYIHFHINRDEELIPDQFIPPRESINHDNYLTMVSKFEDNTSFQFTFADGSKSTFADENMINKHPTKKYIDYQINEASEVHGGAVIYEHDSGWLWGIKLWSRYRGI